jgi:hypothetical protein
LKNRLKNVVDTLEEKKLEEKKMRCIELEEHHEKQMKTKKVEKSLF